MITTWILYCLIISASFGLAAFAGERALSQYRWSVRWVWVASIVGSIVFPLGMLIAPSLMRAMSPVMSADAGAAIYLPALVSASPRPTDAAGILNPVALNALLAWAWGLSVALVGLRLVGSYGRLRKEMRGWTPGRILDAPVLLSEDRGPAVVGVRRAVIVMPQWIGELEQKLLRLVFLHEREHQQAGDHRLFALGIAALLTMPWNPMMWWQLKRLRLAIEFDCDRRVLGHGVDPRDYAEALLVVGSRVSGPLLAAAAFAERKPSVERRLRRMTEPLRKLRGPRAILATAIGVFGILFACGSPMPIGPGDGENTDPQASQMRNPDVVELDNTDPSAGPAFIPYDTPPQLDNVRDIQAALQEHYPQDLNDAGVGGRVEIWLYVDESGAVANHQIKTSGGNPRLDEAAELVASQMHFSPAENQGETTSVWVTQWFTFVPAVERAELFVVPTRDASQPSSDRSLQFGDSAEDGVLRASRLADDDAVGNPNDPLIVIDGVIQAREISLREINALQIDHIEILKGPAAEEAYGTRGRNGVVEVTTRDGATP